MDARANPFISCVIPMYNEDELICDFLQALSAQLAQESLHYELVVVDDGSCDRSVEKVRGILSDLPVRLITLSRNFGKERALTAGLDAVKGDVVIVMDADFQHPLSVIPEFMAGWREGYDMVYAVRRDRMYEGVIKRTITNNFYRFIKAASGVDIPPNAGDFRLMNRKVVEAIKRLPERQRFMKGIYAWVGFRSKSITFDVSDRPAGSSGWSKLRLINLALTGITSFTELPLRLVALMGMLIAFFAVIFGVYILVSTLLFGNSVAGWPTLIDVVAFLGGLQMFAIGLLGEYIAGIFSEVKQRPIYIVASEEQTKYQEQSLNENGSSAHKPDEGYAE